MNKINQNTLNLLENIGLNKNEAQIYELLLNVGALGMKSILFHTKLKRGNAYYHLDSLEEKGLIEKIDLPKTTIKFAAKHPENLELILAKQKSYILNAEQELQKNFPQLNSLFQLLTQKPGVKFYEGKEGIIKVYDYILSLGNPIDSFEDRGEMANLISAYANEFILKRVKKKIFNRVIAPSTNTINKNDLRELRETHFVDPNKFPFRMDIKISGPLVSIITFQKQNPVAILIENNEISENFKLLFNFVWDLTKPQTGLRKN
jgi:sugar-specific transcriptional regulator TrmB